ncbi:PASTA domain-containing protein [Agrococcus sp. DT81.2]|uniref:PASTA domain-containing protein n=1 Tax=Agrococcus sp. DT81.2 TaxID=3393414 RepID=UPI003CE55A07
MTLQGLSFGTRGTSGSANLVMVPDVEGLDPGDARKELEDRGFRVVLLYVEAPGEPDDSVTSQRPEKDEPRPRGSSVSIFVVKNPTMSADWTARFDQIDGALALLESDGKAESRKKEILDAIDAATTTITKAGGPPSKSTP